MLLRYKISIYIFVQLASSMMWHAILLNIEHRIRKFHGKMKLKDLGTQYLQVCRNALNSDDFGFNNLKTLYFLR